MLKSYDYTDLLWDTWTGRWVRPAPRKAVPVVVRKLFVERDKTWKEDLMGWYTERRTLPEWDHFKSLFEPEDQRFFDILDEVKK